MPDMNMNGAPMPTDDHEAAMARADLYKLANYSFKLFKMIKDGDELEGWVQAKITKAADYIASVFHYMEYELKVNEYGDKLENSDVYGESVRREFKLKLTEARVKLEKLKKKNIKDVAEEVKADKKATVNELSKKTLGSYISKSSNDDGDGYTSPKLGRTAGVTKAAYRTQGLAHKKGTEGFRKYKSEGAVDEAGKEKKVKEATVNELSGATLKSYKKGATDDFQQRYPKAQKTFAKGVKHASPDEIENVRKMTGRVSGLVKAAKRGKVGEGSIQGGVWVAQPDRGVPAPTDPEGVAPSKKPKAPGTSANALMQPNKYNPKAKVIPSDPEGVKKVTELSRGTLRSYSKAASHDVHADQRDAKGAYDMSGEAGAHGDTKKSAAWDDEGMWLAKRAEKRAGNIAKATTKIARKR